MEEKIICCLCMNERDKCEMQNMSAYGCTCPTPLVCQACLFKWILEQSGGNATVINLQKYSCPVCRQVPPPPKKNTVIVQVENPHYPCAPPLPSVRFLNVPIHDAYYFKHKNVYSLFKDHCGDRCSTLNNLGFTYYVETKKGKCFTDTRMHMEMIGIRKSRTCFLFMLHCTNVNSFTWNQYEYDCRHTNSDQYASGRAFDEWCGIQLDTMRTLIFQFLDLLFATVQDVILRNAVLSSFNWLAEMQRGKDSYIETLKLIRDDPLKKLCDHAINHFSAYYATGETQPDLTYMQFYYQ